MHPVLLKIGDFTLPSYYTLLTIGFLAAVWLAWREAQRVGVDPDDMLDLSLWCLVVGLLGSRVLHVFADGFFWDYVHLCTDPLKVDVASFIHVKCINDAACVTADAGALCHPETGRCHPGRDCFAALRFWQGGLAFYGAFIAAVPFSLWFMRRRGMANWKVFDIAAFGFPIGQAFGRLGCYFAGCCFGRTTTGPLGVQFSGYVARLGADSTCPKGYDLVATVAGEKICAFGRPAFMHHAEHDLLTVGSKLSVPVHATQLYEAFFALGIFVFIWFWRRPRSRFDGQAFWEYALAYGSFRFVVEFFRDDERGLWFGDLVSTSQLVALPIVAVALWGLLRGHRRASAPQSEMS